MLSIYVKVYIFFYQAKRNLESALARWVDFEHSYQHMSDWMMNVEHRLETSPDYKSDLPEKKSNLERCKVLVVAFKV